MGGGGSKLIFSVFLVHNFPNKSMSAGGGEVHVCERLSPGMQSLHCLYCSSTILSDIHPFLRVFEFLRVWMTKQNGQENSQNCSYLTFLEFVCDNSNI
jgi:hypothetical protein